MTTDLHSLAAAYALDALDPDECEQFEAHLASCATCTAEVAEFRSVVATMAESTSETPPPHLKSAIMSRLDDVPQERPESAPPVFAPPAVAPTAAASAPAAPTPAPPVVDLAERRRRKLSLPNLLAAAAAVALIAVGAVVISGNRGGTDYDDVVAAADAVVTQLEGETGTIEVAYSDDLDRVAVRGSGLDDLDPTLRYALWAIADGTPIPAGLFAPGDGSIDYVTELTGVTAQAWGVTIESAEGADAPTTEIIYFAEV